MLTLKGLDSFDSSLSLLSFSKPSCWHNQTSVQCKIINFYLHFQQLFQEGTFVIDNLNAWKKFSPSIFQSSSVRWLSSEWTPFAPSAVVVTSRAWKINLNHERVISVIYWNKCLDEICWSKGWKKKFYFDWSWITDTSKCFSYTKQAKTSFLSKVSVSSSV